MGYYALIMAGGGGTRLWPLSRRDRPKQTLALIDSRTMFQISVERLAPLFEPEQIFVVTGEPHLDTLREQAPDIPVKNFIVEPARRDTGPAAGLGTLYISKHDPDAVIAILTADHHIAYPERFRQVLAAAYTLAQRDYIVTLGIPPAFPSSGYAYLRRGVWLDEVEGFPCYKVTNLYEKPEPDIAAKFLLAGNYSWNSGMLIWRAQLALESYRLRQPVLGAIFDRVGPVIGTPEYEAVLEQWFPAAPKLSVDKAIMQDATNMVVLTADIGWSDVGSWTTLYDVMRPDEDADENVLHQNTPSGIQLRTRGTLIISKRLVVTIGVEDIVIVDTDDVLLVCRRNQSEDVRQVVEMLREWGLEEYL
ncbi:MAG: mannose-1-phosphate guanylyltransferase [Anaerolineae bacterium]|nr:mannose-1-phosphate guanylyltransferase [Anaerolineae bacterium]